MGGVAAEVLTISSASDARCGWKRSTPSQRSGLPTLLRSALLQPHVDEGITCLGLRHNYALKPAMNRFALLSYVAKPAAVSTLLLPCGVRDTLVFGLARREAVMCVCYATPTE